MGFVDLNDMPFDVLEGTNRKVLQADNMTMLFIDREPNVVQDHSHPQEQVVFLREGRLKVSMGGEERIVEAGNAIQIPGGLQHRIETLEQSLILSVYSPARDLSALTQPT